MGKLVAIVAASEMMREYTERRKHDTAIEQLRKAHIERVHKQQERIDFINEQLGLETAVETKFTELNEAMIEYHEVSGQGLPPLP